MKKILLIIILTFCIFQMIVLATAIDIGTSEVIDRPNAYPKDMTFILVENPANETGEINEIKVWVADNCTNFTVATFELIGGTTFTARDSEVIGAVTAGGVRTFAVTLNVEAGDYLGYYTNSVGDTVECTLSGDGVWEKAGDQTKCVEVKFAEGANRTLSLYGTGATAGWSHKWNTATISKWNTATFTKWNTIP